MTSISSNPFLTPALIRQSAELRAKLQSATQEMTTGRYGNPGTALRGDFSALAATDHRLARITGYAATTGELALTGEAMQRALGTISRVSEELAATLLQTATGLSASQLATATAVGARDFSTVISALNTRFSERSVFGGTGSDQSPLPEPETILAALETAIQGMTTPDTLSTAINDWFADPAGYAALYAGGPAVPPIAIAPGETAGFPVTALDPAIRETLIGFAKIALLDRGLLAGDHAARAELALSAGEDLQGAAESRAILAGRIGTTEQQIARAQARNSAEKSALSIARNGITGADPYEAAIRLQDLESRLDAFYTLTTRLSRLSLTEYMR